MFTHLITRRSLPFLFAFACQIHTWLISACFAVGTSWLAADRTTTGLVYVFGSRRIKTLQQPQRVLRLLKAPPLEQRKVVVLSCHLACWSLFWHQAEWIPKPQCDWPLTSSEKWAECRVTKSCSSWGRSQEVRLMSQERIPVWTESHRESMVTESGHRV